MKKSVIVLVLVFCCVAHAIAEDIYSQFYFQDGYGVSKKTKVAVLNFECNPGWSSGDGTYLRTIEKKNLEKLETVLLQSGFSLVERNRLEKLLDEKKLSLAGLTDSKYQEIGSFLNADIVVFGLIPSWTYFQGRKTGTIEIMIKAIDVNTGGIVFKAIYNHQFKTDDETFRYDISKVEDRIYFELFGKELRKRIGD